VLHTFFLKCVAILSGTSRGWSFFSTFGCYGVDVVFSFQVSFAYLLSLTTVSTRAFSNSFLSAAKPPPLPPGRQPRDFVLLVSFPSPFGTLESSSLEHGFFSFSPSTPPSFTIWLRTKTPGQFSIPPLRGFSAKTTVVLFLSALLRKDV